MRLRNKPVTWKSLVEPGLWELLVQVGPDSLIPQLDIWVTLHTLQLVGAVICRTGAVRQCGESWHTVTVTLSQMRRQQDRSYPGPGDQKPREVVGSNRLGTRRLSNWPLVFSLQLILTMVADGWVVNRNGCFCLLPCWPASQI